MDGTLLDTITNLAVSKISVVSFIIIVFGIFGIIYYFIKDKFK